MKTLHFFDMDGVLARFDDEKNAVQRFQREAHFFLGLKPYENTLKEVQALINKGENVYILTASPHKGADMDKREWIRRYLPSLPSSHFIAVRLGAVKVDAVKPLKKARYILYDDYSKNRLEWCARGRHFLAVETRGQWMELKPITAENYRISVNYGRMAVDVDTPIKGYPSSFNIPYPFYVDGRKLSRARAVKYCLERLGYTTSK